MVRFSIALVSYFQSDPSGSLKGCRLELSSAQGTGSTHDPAPSPTLETIC